MFKLDEQITRAYFRMEEAQLQRLRMARFWHPETFKWTKATPPKMSEAKLIRRSEMSKMGLGELFYQRMLEQEKKAKAHLETLAQEHCLWEHMQRLRGFGPYLCGAFIAAGGDITHSPTVSAFWKGMGLHLLPDGTVPRRSRDTKIPYPCLPHVSRIGEQIRQQIIRSGGKLRAYYDAVRIRVDAENPDRAKVFNFKSAIRQTQKILYSTLWKCWRQGYGLETPSPYPFAILHHTSKVMEVSDFYDR